MTRVITLAAALALGVLGLAGAFSSASADSVNIGINIGPPPPPPIVLAAPPPLIIVPGTPVYYAPSVSFNLFASGGHYYTFHQGAWFVAARPGGPWRYAAVEQVPMPVRAVPAGYYRIPPGHARKAGGPPPGAGRGRGPARSR